MRWRAVLTAVAALALTAVPPAATAGTAQGAPVPPTLVAGQSVTSADGRFRLDMQRDGNLVLYRTSGGHLWHARTWGNPGARLVVQPDGNAVVYTPAGRALWHSGTHDGARNRMELRDDGRLLVLSPGGGVRWSSAPPDLRAGDQVSALDRSHRLVLQSDGNLVVYARDGRAVWHASTAGTDVVRAVMQPDGNLVAYDRHGVPVWHTATSGNAGARLAMQADGNLVVYARDGRPLWASRWSTGTAFLPPFAATVTGVDAAALGASWQTGCPVGPSDLRRLRLRVVGFDGRWRTGEVIVHAAHTDGVRRVFARLYGARFPLASVRPVSAFDGSDDASMRANNTSGFNCRRVAGSSAWSEHAYGRAVDVNPVQNPYVSGGTVAPPAGSAYLDRRHVRPGMVVAGGPVTAAFGAEGWGWGGTWSSAKDYQHFSATGR